MAKRRDGEVIELKPSQVSTAGDAGDEFEDASITRFLMERATGATDATVKVFRAAGSPGPDKVKLARDQFLYQTGPDDFTEEFLQSEYGAGTYRIRLYGSMGGNYGLIVNRLLEVGPPPRSKLPAQLGAASPGVTVNAGDGSEIAKAMAQAMAPVFAALTSVLQQVMAGASNRAQSLAELKELAAIVGLTGGQRNTSDPMTQLTAMVTLAKELIGQGDDGGGREPSTGAILMKAMENFAPMLQGRIPGASAPQPQLAAPAQPAQPVAQPQPQGEAVNLALKAQLLVLLNAARAGSDPNVYATLIYENAPDEVLDVLESPQWFAELCRLEPGFAAARPWAEQVRAIVLQAMTQEPEGADYAPNAAALTPEPDGANVAGDAGKTEGVSR